MQLLIIAKVVALEGTLKQHFPEAYDSYLALLKTSVEELYPHGYFDSHPRLKEELEKLFDLKSGPEQ